MEPTMPSESAKMSTAAEAKFRINAPNSQPRAVKVIALDKGSEAVAKRLAAGQWNRASFFGGSAFRKGQTVDDAWLADLAGKPTTLAAELANADLVVLIATAGENADAAAVIGDACKAKRVVTSALIVGSEQRSDAALAQTLARLRPNALMVVIAADDDYIADMLTALRA
jgi:hypothetical protein